MSVLVSPAEATDALRELVAWADEIVLAYAWMAGASAAREHWRLLPLSKVAQAVVGIHFAQTEPDVLRALRGTGVLRVIPDTGGVFHPKVLFARRGDEARALLGSSNFTAGGFAGNTEINVLLSGAAACGQMQRIRSFIGEQWTHPRSFEPDDDWMERYERMFASRPLPPIMREPRRARQPTVESPKDLDIEWSDFVDLIGRQERRSLNNGWSIHVFDFPDGSYLQEVEGSQLAFAAAARFADIPLDGRKLIAGWGGGSAGYFGRMTGAGWFKNMTSEHPEMIGRVLDRLPMDGIVSLDDAEQTLEQLVAIEGVGLGVATRLVSMKRPDLFLPANNASVPQISRVFGVRPNSVNRFREVLEQIWEYPWFSAPEPRGRQERRIWRARVALLDAIFYEPV
ncbi:phospholipase D family protein [Myxococcus sp. CA039A]|uniref:phospholipase D family protein n=1 Tax=Myxococcus sp. CA039A TaxID=2741737 RepID=UPI00157AFC70|nr:hypothetical protein [Myxococcus sp. CA039A]